MKDFIRILGEYINNHNAPISEKIYYWIARDTDGDLWLYNRELEKKFGGFIPTDDNCDIMAIDNDLFPEVTFENSPQKVELKLIKI